MRDPRDVATAHEFVVGIDLRGLSVSILEAEAEPIDYDSVKNQTLVVGSDIVSFVKGVTAEYRQDIANSALLAQLVAKKNVPGTQQRVVGNPGAGLCRVCGSKR